MRYFTIIIFLFSTCLSGCDESPSISIDPIQNPQENIIGSWELFKQTNNGVEENFSKNCDLPYTYEFQNQGKFVTSFCLDTDVYNYDMSWFIKENEAGELLLKINHGRSYFLGGNIQKINELELEYIAFDTNSLGNERKLFFRKVD